MFNIFSGQKIQKDDDLQVDEYDLSITEKESSITLR